MTFKMVVFDWDGTLLDSTGAIARSIRQACITVGLPDPGSALASYVIGMGLVEALRHAAPSASEVQISQMVDAYRQHYLSRDHELELFSGVHPLLKSLNDMQIICTVATGKARQGLNRAMTNSNTAQYFMGSRCADECHSKPHPQMLLELMTEFDVPAQQVLMVGDTTHDLNMARAAGVQAVSVQTGAHPPKLLNEIAHLNTFVSINEMAPWLLRILAEMPE
jgi:phosphoglycolate phosphatase